MPSKPFKIEPFKGLPDVAEIVGVGQVIQSVGPAIEPTFSILLANGLDGPGPHACATRSVGCGQLDLLAVGSRWTAGRHVADGPAVTVTATVKFKKMRDLHAGVDRPAYKIRRFPSSSIASAPCFYVKLKDVAASGGVVPEWAVVPTTELVRALFGMSSPFLQQLIDGVRDGRVSGDRAFVDRSRSGSSPSDSSKVVLWCQRKLNEREAVMMALVLTDDAVRESHDSVFQQLSADARWRRGEPVWLKMAWPFPEPVRWTFEGRWYHHDAGKNFLVTRITAIDLPITFETIDMHHPGARAGSAEKDVPFVSSRLMYSGGRVALLTTGTPPSSSRRPTTISSPDVAMLSAAGVKVNAIAHGGPAQPSAAGLGEEPRDETPASTAGREPGANPGVGRAVVGRSGDDPLPDDRSRVESLIATLAALRLCARREGWALKDFPSFHGATGRVSDPFDFAKDMLLVEVETSGGYAMVADLGSPLRARRSLGILVKDSRSNLDARGARAIRATGIELDGSWGRDGAKVPGFVLTAVRRPTAHWKDLDAYASLLARRLRSALNA